MAFKLATLTLLLVALANLAIESEARFLRTGARDKRSAYPPYHYPQRTMMLTGFYRPTRRSEEADQAGVVYTQGDSVSGGAYFDRRPTKHHKNDGPQPGDQLEIASADAEASPAAEAQEDDYAAEPKPQDDADSATENPIFQDSPKPAHGQPSKSKKSKQIPVPADSESDEYEGEEEDEPLSPFRPGNRKPNKQYPSLNNYFPVVFSFPRAGAAVAGGRRGSTSGSAESIPGLIAAIANSYSTGKGGVASSVATAYGGPTTRKQRRPSQSLVR